MRGLRLRDARPADRKAVFDFCSNTWPGYGDYIQGVWTEWIRDRKGRLILAEYRGRPVGLAKVSVFSPGEIWLQGLRVDPSLRHMGIANDINLEVLRTVKRMKPRAVRFCTGARNHASRHIGEKFGFELTVRFRFFWCKTRKGRVRGRVARMKDFDAAFGFIRNSRFLKASRGMIAEGWVFREFSGEVLKKYLKSGDVMLLEGRGGIRGLAIYTADREDQANPLSLGFVDGDASSIKALARNGLYMAGRQGYKYCSAAVPTTYFARLLRWSVYGSAETMGQVVYELPGERLGRM